MRGPIRDLHIARKNEIFQHKRIARSLEKLKSALEDEEKKINLRKSKSVSNLEEK